MRTGMALVEWQGDDEIAGYPGAGDHLADEIAAARVMLDAAVRRTLVGANHVDSDASLRRLRADLAHRRGRIRARLAASASSELPITRLRDRLGVTEPELTILMLLVALETDQRLRDDARAFTAARDAAEPDVALLLTLLESHTAPLTPLALATDSALVRFALIQVRDQDQALIVRRVSATERTVNLAHGRDVMDRDLRRMVEVIQPSDGPPPVVPGAQLAAVTGLLATAVAAAAQAAAPPVLLMPGPEGVGRKTLVAAAAASLARPVLRVRAGALPPAEDSLRDLAPRLQREALWHNAVVVIDRVDDLAGTSHVPLDEVLFPEGTTPLVATCAPLAGAPPRFQRGSVVVTVEPPDQAAREVLWRCALGPRGSQALAAFAAERYAIVPGVIAATATAALALASVRDERAGAPTPLEIHEALRGVLDAKLSTLGTRITWRQTWDDLVLPDDAVDEIIEFIARVQHRRQVYDAWGFGQKVAKGRGLSALFAGPPGTGKTMVAGLIARELGLDLYQIDLSKVVSKWVGETEKNLGALFDAAEAGHAVLLFDEADALFAKRTQVQSSNDRYANLEVNYLLQRLEAFSGIVILTTNHEPAIDEAFRRRLSLRVEFPVPEAAERERLWRAVLPQEAQIAADVDLAALAARYEMTGGYIKNAAVRAAFLAAAEGTPITMHHLTRAARSEYQAMGKVVGHL